MTVVALALPQLRLSEREDEIAAGLRLRLAQVARKNREKSDLYEGKRSAFDLGISAPAQLPELVNAVMGWPGNVVDVLEERLDFLGWTATEDLGLDVVFRENHLAVESGRGHLDTLIYGCGFVTVGRGDVAGGEPEVLVSVESTESCTVEWDFRRRAPSAALSQTRDENGVVVMETLYLPDETILFERVRGGLAVIRRDRGLGRVPVARLLNRDRASDVNGRSEITRPVVYWTDAAVRTLTGMEINREFYTSPKWTMLNTDPEVFGMSEDKSASENRRAGWSATQGRMNVVPPQENANGEPIEPKLHEFRPAPPTPYIEQIKAYAQLVAAESGMPASYLGFVTENPPSADSIQQQETRLVKRAQRRQTQFGMAWLDVARLVLLMRDGAVDPAMLRSVDVSWANPRTPTPAAAADEVAKLIGAGVLPPASPVTWERAGFSPQQQQQLAAEFRRSQGSTALQTLLAAAQQTQTEGVQQS